MNEKADAIRRVIAAHSGHGRGLELATSMNLSAGDYAAAHLLQRAVMRDDNWRNKRSPHGMMVDCIYLCAKRKGDKISVAKMSKLTFKIFGVGTQPRPNIWQNNFAKMIEDWI